MSCLFILTCGGRRFRKYTMEKPPDYSHQKTELQPLLSHKLRKGDEWYLVDQRWLKQWKKYAGYDSWDQYHAGKDSVHPGPVDNTNLFEDSTDECLKEHLMEELHYALLPKAAWDKLTSWYSLKPGSRPICRHVVEYGTYVKHLKVEVYLFNLKVYLHPHVKSALVSRAETVESVQDKLRVTFGIGEDVKMRFWQHDMTKTYVLIRNTTQKVVEHGRQVGGQLFLELGDRNGEWPKNSFKKSSLPGLCGLSNLGNTCFMNSALQCLSNAQSLTEYFLGKEGAEANPHINLDNQLGTLTKNYVDLLANMWSGKYSYLVPYQLKMMLDEHVPEFADTQQQDIIQFLGCFLHRLHEELSLLVVKTSHSMKAESNPKTMWYKHVNNQSVIISQFQGQFISIYNCLKCKKVSRMLNPFMYLSLPVPVETRDVLIYLVRADPTSDTVRYRLTVPRNGIVLELKQAMQNVAGIDPKNLVVIDVYNSRFHRVYYDKDQISQIMDRDDIYLYELATPLGDTDWVPVYMREKKVQKSYSYFSSKTSYSSYGQVFGLPIVVTVPRDGCTYRQLYSILLAQTRRYLYVTVPTKGKTTADESPGQDDSPDDTDLFTLSIVNSYGSQEVKKLKDDDNIIKLTSSTYVSCDWTLESKDKFYDVKKAQGYSEDKSCTAKKCISIYDCLDLFAHQEQLAIIGQDDAWYCPQCKDSVEAAYKKFDVWKLPDILVIHLKRFSYSKQERSKIETKVQFPLTGLNLSNYVVNQDHAVYDLFGVSNQFGGLGGEHYTAYCKNKYTQKWYSFDDNLFSEVNVDSVCSSSSYVLFYARQSDGGDTCKRGVDRSLSVHFMDMLKQENEGLKNQVQKLEQTCKETSQQITDITLQNQVKQSRLEARQQQIGEENHQLHQLVKGKDDLIRRNKESIHQQQDFIQLKDESIQRKDEIIRQKDGSIQEARGAVQEKEEAVQRKDQVIRLKEAEIVDLRNQLEYRSWILQRNEVQITDKLIGEGAYGQVKVAIFWGTRVAAKCLHEIIVSRHNRDIFTREMDISSKIHHPNIVQFLGATRVDNPILLYELMATSLYKRLQEDESLTRSQIATICCDIASALCYLHQWMPHPIIHRDVSSPNVLMEPLANNRWRSKLSDFGSANLQLHVKTVIPGNPAYAAPEALVPQHHTPAMDVYSFGVLVTEMILHSAPEMDLGRRERAAHAIEWASMKEIVLKCIKDDREQRISSVQLLKELQKF